MTRLLCVLALGTPLIALTAGAQRGGAAPVVAHGVITGTVTDTNLRAISGADVMVVGTNSRLTADADGRFTILEVPPGEFLIWVRRLGYRPVSSVVHVEPGDSLRLAFLLVLQFHIICGGHDSGRGGQRSGGHAASGSAR